MPNPTQPPKAESYHGQMMNAPVDMMAVTDTYAVGHRDARHACAEIAAEADARIAALEGELTKLLVHTVDIHRSRQTGGWIVPRTGYGREAADRLVSLNRWEHHPDEPGLYRPVTATPAGGAR